jgi:predicted metallo-beta-lactamase superfamily hydrolase
MTLVVDRLRTYFVNETNGMHVEMHRWYSTNDLFKWLELDSIIQQTLLEKRMRAIRVYRPPSYLNFEEHQLTMRRYEEDLIRKGVSSLKRCLNDAMEVMIDDGLLRKHRHTSVFIQPTEKLFRQGEVRVWKYEETMDMAYLLVEQRDSLQKKLNHLNYLIGCLKYVAQNNAFKQV